MKLNMDPVLFVVLMLNMLMKISGQDSIIKKCREVVFSCSCGNPGYFFLAAFRQCHYWLPKEEACTRYQYCLECESGIKNCVTCPPNRYGNLCRGICSCKDGELCQRDTGQCIQQSNISRDKTGTATEGTITECHIPTIEFPLKQQIKYLNNGKVEIEYTCETNYELVGNSKISCINGHWNENPPSCVISEKESCPPDDDEFLFGNKKYEISSQLIRKNINGKDIITYPVKSLILYSCDNYYILNGVSKRQCQSNGEWSGIQPRCKPECGISADKIPFIINGTKAELGEWPWQVAIAYNTNHVICGGSLLSEEWILTAAHCITSNKTLQNKIIFKILFGKYYRYSNDDNVQIRDVERFIVHESYNPTILDNDIALIQVKSIKLTNFIRPVCLTTLQLSYQNLAIGSMGTVTGWGQDETGTYSDILKKTNLTVISPRTCSESNKLEITNNMFCAGDPNGQTDTCVGDSGGPMVFPVKSFGKTRWVLEGIVSWGNVEGCAIPNKYGGFTKVSNFIDWIRYYVSI